MCSIPAASPVGVIIATPKNDIGQIGDGRICKSSFDMRCPQCNGRAEHNRNRSCNQHHILRPCANQKFRTEGVIRQTDDGKYTGFYDCHGMQQSRNGCGGNGCLRQPAIKREIPPLLHQSRRTPAQIPTAASVHCLQSNRDSAHHRKPKICRCAVEQHKHEPDNARDAPNII